MRYHQSLYWPQMFSPSKTVPPKLESGLAICAVPLPEDIRADSVSSHPASCYPSHLVCGHACV